MTSSTVAPLCDGLPVREKLVGLLVYVEVGQKQYLRERALITKSRTVSRYVRDLIDADRDERELCLAAQEVIVKDRYPQHLLTPGRDVE